MASTVCLAVWGLFLGPLSCVSVFHLSLVLPVLFLTFFMFPKISWFFAVSLLCLLAFCCMKGVHLLLVALQL